MNREIKFRAWDKINKKLCETIGRDALWMNMIGEITFPEAGWDINGPVSLPEEQGIVIMQFTGLKDKNGKEIYEGDIAEVHYTDGSGYDHPVEVSFEKGSFWVGMGYLNDVKIIEVIGNIYENPELLKEPPHE